MKIDLTNRKFGRWLVLAFAGKNKHGKNSWLCQCSCGKTSNKPITTYLLSGKTSSCGCIREKLRKRPYEHLFTKLKREAKRRGILVDLTYTDFLAFTEIKTCHYCGIGLLWEQHGNGSCPVKGRYNLDRKDNLIGYTNKNCVVCCPRCNASKSNTFSYSEWKSVGTLIASWRKVAHEKVPL
jgi:hypothetical protein